MAPETQPKTLWDFIRFDEQGLIPVIAQSANSGEVLMLAWMNRDALTETLATGHMCYWSRSRATLWRKGEKSGQTQKLLSLAIDCDGDALLAKVEQTGVACHTGRRFCFFHEVRADGSLTVHLEPDADPEKLYGK